MVRQPHIYTMPEAFITDDRVPLYWKLYALINGFWISGNPVFASNKWFAEKLNCSERYIRECLEKLEGMKVLVREGNSQNRRIIPRGVVTIKGGTSSSGGEEPVVPPREEPVVPPREEPVVPHNSVSEFSKSNNTIASETDAEDLEVISTDEDGNPLKPVKQKKVSRYLQPFDFGREIKKLESSEFVPNPIIAFYFVERKWKCENYAVWQAAYNRHLPAAKRLVGFDKKSIIRGFKLAEEATPDWTLETVLKVLTK